MPNIGCIRRIVRDVNLCFFSSEKWRSLQHFFFRAIKGNSRRLRGVLASSDSSRKHRNRSSLVYGVSQGRHVQLSTIWGSYVSISTSHSQLLEIMLTSAIPLSFSSSHENTSIYCLNTHILHNSYHTLVSCCIPAVVSVQSDYTQPTERVTLEPPVNIANSFQSFKKMPLQYTYVKEKIVRKSLRRLCGLLPVQ